MESDNLGNVELHYCPGAISFCVHWALIDTGIGFDSWLVDLSAGEHNSVAYRQVNPRGKVPMIVYGDERHGECSALLMWIAEQQWGRYLSPAPGCPGRFEWLEWMLFLANGPLPAIGDWLYAEKNAGVSNGTIIKDEASRKLQLFWGEIDARLLVREENGHFLGKTLTTVDLLLAMLTFWSLPTSSPASHWSNILAYMQYIQQSDSFIETVKREKLFNLLDPIDRI